jgi:O-antigen/teichoic acid export membrane protein
MKTALANLILRGFAIAGRFLVLIGIGKYLSESDLGTYGLFYSTIILSLYFIGLDFYTFTTREIIAADPADRLRIIRNQFVFHLLSYLVILPVLLPVFFFQIVPFEFMVWFYFVLIFEHLSQEFFRIFIALSRSVFANFISFIRSGLWVIVLGVLWMLQVQSMISLRVILIAWAAGAALSVVIPVFYLRFILNTPLPPFRIEWRWMKHGLITALPFFTGSVCYKIIEHANRYYIDFFQGKELVGIFTFYAGIANIVSVIVNTAVIIVVYPKLYEYYINQNWPKYKEEQRRFYRQVLLLSLSSGLLLALVIYPIITVTGKSASFLPNITAYYYLIIANIVLNISLIPHFILYVQKKDITIMNITLAGMIINLIINYFLIRTYGIDGAAVAMILSFIFIAVGKFYFVSRAGSLPIDPGRTEPL